ncbi:hypothetical protein SDC9_117284 [bioreactor metagenome]|uniref:Uncharacterized protein n=1 Tax=bioreactor metagenome TaxID=1076179 RepID=A0A645BY81_9ZZZZ
MRGGGVKAGDQLGILAQLLIYASVKNSYILLRVSLDRQFGGRGVVHHHICRHLTVVDRIYPVIDYYRPLFEASLEFVRHTDDPLPQFVDAAA